MVIKIACRKFLEDNARCCSNNIIFIHNAGTYNLSWNLIWNWFLRFWNILGWAWFWYFYAYLYDILSSKIWMKQNLIWMDIYLERLSINLKFSKDWCACLHNYYPSQHQLCHQMNLKKDRFPFKMPQIHDRNLSSQQLSLDDTSLVLQNFWHVRFWGGMAFSVAAVAAAKPWITDISHVRPFHKPINGIHRAPCMRSQRGR